MRVSFWQPSSAVTQGGTPWPAYYRPGAFNWLIGRDVPVTGPGGQDEAGRALVVAADVDADGGGITWTLESELFQVQPRNRYGGSPFP
jgi:hypothetical protein